VLGAVHGVNPGMGWLFAVARGVQEGDGAGAGPGDVEGRWRGRRAVWAALGPLAVGHGLAIAAAIALAEMFGSVVPMTAVRWLVGVGLVTRGMMSLVRHRHPRAGGMRIGSGGLVWWSFLMASAHGAGLMALPLVLENSASHDHASTWMSMTPALDGTAWAATAAHAIGYLAVTGLVAFIVYERTGVRILRSAWINVDLLWAIALIVTGAATLAL
jgi:hypothetical protein